MDNREGFLLQFKKTPSFAILADQPEELSSQAASLRQSIDFFKADGGQRAVIRQLEEPQDHER